MSQNASIGLVRTSTADAMAGGDVPREKTKRTVPQASVLDQLIRACRPTMSHSFAYLRRVCRMASSIVLARPTSSTSVAKCILSLKILLGFDVEARICA